MDVWLGMTSRFRVRSDKDCRERLDELADNRGIPAAKVVRQLIDQANEEVLREMRLEAAERLIALNLEAPDDPGELSRQLETAHDLSLIHI